MKQLEESILREEPTKMAISPQMYLSTKLKGDTLILSIIKLKVEYKASKLTPIKGKKTKNSKKNLPLFQIEEQSEFEQIAYPPRLFSFQDQDVANIKVPEEESIEFNFGAIRSFSIQNISERRPST